MANLSKTKTLFAFTSPRTIEKIIPEIQVLINGFSGQIWNTETQIKFFKDLFNSGFYDGSRMPENISLAARDRITRAPKALGFVDLKPVIKITAVGEALISGKRAHEIIAKQLFKFQFPSPYHKLPKDIYCIKPYLELLRLIKELGNISKTEIALYFVQLTHYNKLNKIIKNIKTFRTSFKSSKESWKTYVDRCFTKEILKIYADEIKTNNLKTRESSDTSLKKFIATKRSNLIDYADAFTRYLRATQLISFDKKTFRAIISPSKEQEVEFILSNIERKAFEFKNEEEYKTFLFSTSNVIFLNDDKKYLTNRLLKLGVTYSDRNAIEELKDILELAEQRIIKETIKKTEVELKNYQEFNDILSVFKKINQKEVPDPPLFLEWNIWRAMVMLNYALQIKGNFMMDLDGVPLKTALGNMPDIEAEYEDFKMIVEVTMSAGNKQYEIEGEPVARHFGNIQKTSTKPVYCLFVAPKISEGALAHFFNLNRMNTKLYGGKTRIIPMDLNQFVYFISIAKEKNFNNSNILKSYLDSIVSENQNMKDEMLWFDSIDKSIPDWVC